MRIWIVGLALLSAGAPLLAQSGAISRAKQVTASYTLDLAPAPDGKRAVMIRIVGGREQLFLVNPDGSGERQITTDDADHEDPAWSPDGTRIAFVLVKDGKKVVHRINADGTGLEPVTPAAQSAIDLATKTVRTVISGGVNTFPVMSPDGRKIAFRKIVGDMNSEVFVADADGSNLRNLTNHHAWEGWPAWSPDSRTIAFAGNRNAAWQIFLIDPDGSNLRLLAATDGRGTSPKWSADGKVIFYTICRSSQERQGCDIFAADVPAAS